VGETRACPHCRTVILASAAVCPKCQHHLRFEPSSPGAPKSAPTATAFHLEGTVRNDGPAPLREYMVVVTVRNEAGEVLGREVVNVGSIRAGDQRSVTLSVEYPLPPEPR
jgi:hypothetical protein